MVLGKKADKLRATAEKKTREALAAKQAADEAEAQFRATMQDLAANR
jgi:hypothetical protein